jgi:hypothetical protein
VLKKSRIMGATILFLPLYRDDEHAVCAKILGQLVS